MRTTAVVGVIARTSSRVLMSGAVLNLAQWQELADKLKAAGTKFVIEPYIRFKGEPGEQATMFFRDPSGNAIEMKAFKSLEQLFAK